MKFEGICFMIIYLTNPTVVGTLKSGIQQGVDMSENLLSGKHLNDEKAAYEHLAKIRWPEGPVCVHCQSKKVYTLKVASTKRVVLKCATCRKQFSATVGTIFERSHIPLNKWFMAFQLMASSKKGMSAHQLHRMLRITYKSAWFLAHQDSPRHEANSVRWQTWRDRRSR